MNSYDVMVLLNLLDAFLSRTECIRVSPPVDAVHTVLPRRSDRGVDCIDARNVPIIMLLSASEDSKLQPIRSSGSCFMFHGMILAAPFLRYTYSPAVPNYSRLPCTAQSGSRSKCNLQIWYDCECL